MSILSPSFHRLPPNSFLIYPISFIYPSPSSIWWPQTGISIPHYFPNPTLFLIPNSSNILPLIRLLFLIFVPDSSFSLNFPQHSILSLTTVHSRSVPLNISLVKNENAVFFLSENWYFSNWGFSIKWLTCCKNGN